MTDLLLVFCTFPDAEKARQIGTTLVESQLAACVNLCQGIQSIYRWQGVIETASETLALFKTTAAAWPAFEGRLRELHPYEVPEILAVPPQEASEAYSGWIREAVRAAADQA